jgi:UDP-N-acetyl-D-mannosaminuronic acid dehydrogenase
VQQKIAMANKPHKDPIVIVGLGYVGLTLAAFMADRGFQVHGTEIRNFILKDLELRKAYFSESNLNNVLKRVIDKGLFTFSGDVPVSQTNRVFIITVGTPLHSDGKVNLDFITNVAREVERSAINGDMVILRSTVKLGTTNKVIRPILESNGKKINLAFCPERTLEGAALSELESLPQVIGADTEKELELASKIFSQVTSKVVLVSNIETAELIKLTDNVQRDIHFAISNEVARAANNFPIKASEVISAGKFGYPRTNLSSPGPVGGPCLEKDSFILAESLGWKNSLAQSARETNLSVVHESISHINLLINGLGIKNPKVSILGLAFKGIPETNDLRGSVSIQIHNALQRKLPDLEIYGFDPMVSQEEAAAYGIKMHGDLESAFDETNVVLIANNNKIFANLDLISLSTRLSKPSLIYDYWSRFDNKLSLPHGVHYSSWGSHGYFGGRI